MCSATIDSLIYKLRTTNIALKCKNTTRMKETSVSKILVPCGGDTKTRFKIPIRRMVEIIKFRLPL